MMVKYITAVTKTGFKSTLRVLEAVVLLRQPIYWPEFIPRDERTYYAVKNGKYTGIVVRKDAFDAEDGPRKTYEELMKFLNSEDEGKEE